MATKRFELMPLNNRLSFISTPKVTHSNFPTSIIREQKPGTGWRRGGVGFTGLNAALVMNNYEPNKRQTKPAKEPRYSVKAANIRWLANVARWPYCRIRDEFGVTRSAIENAVRSTSEVAIKPEQWDDETNTLKGPLDNVGGVG